MLLRSASLVLPAFFFTTLCLFATPSSTQSVLQLASAFSSSHEKSLSAKLSEDLDLATTHLVGKALKSLNPSADLSSSKACAVLKSSKDQTIAGIFHQQRIASLFNCEHEFNIDYAKVQSYAKSDNGNLNLPNLYYAIAILRKDKQVGEFRSQILDNLSNAVDQSDKSLASSAFATLALIEAGGAKLGTRFVQLKDKIGLVNGMLKWSDEYDFNRIVMENGNLRVSSLVTRAIVSLCKSSQESLLNSNQVMQLANFFLLSPTESAQDVADVVQALAALNADMTSLPKPVAITKTGSYPSVKFSMSDVFGKNVESARFSVKIGDDVVDLDASGEADLEKFNLAAGIHSYEVLISGANAYAGIISGKKYTVHKSASTKHKIQSSHLKVMKKGSSDWSSSTGKTTLGDKIQVQFTVTPDEFIAHQAFVRFSFENREGFALAKYNDGVYSTEITMDKAAASVFSGISGKWTVEAIVADQKMAAPIQSTVSSVTVVLPADLETPSFEETLNENFQPKKLIEHMFPEPESRPPSFVSLVFTGLTLAPLLILIILWGIVGFNLKLMSLDLWTLLFHGGITSVIGLYVMYWLEYNMFTTIRYLAIIGVVLICSGNRLLSSVAKRRLQTNEKKTK